MGSFEEDRLASVMIPGPREPLDARLLAKAHEAGRVRGIAEELDGRARADVRRAGSILRAGLREARALHSRERRLVSDALYDGFRWGPFLEAATGLDGFTGRWLGWLVLHGLPASELPDPTAWEAALSGERPVEEAVLAGDAAAWEVLARELGSRAAPFVAASNARAAVHIRVHAGRTSRARLARELASDGIATRPCPHAPHGLEVEGRANLQGHRAFSQGLFEVQDEGSQLLAGLVPAGGRVVDLCAGAGGKALALAAAGSEVLAFDVRPAPLAELKKRARRARLAIDTHLLDPDGGLPASLDLASKADAVLVDAPCSGSGTWRRHPEIRWRLTELGATHALQADILDRAATLVRPGGVLIYGTCSVLPSENEAQVEAFLARHPEFVLDPLDCPGLGGNTLNVAPDTHGTDGFFGARLTRRS